MTYMIPMNENIGIKMNKITYLNKVEFVEDYRYEIKRVLGSPGTEIASFQLFFYYYIGFFQKFLDFFCI